MEMPGRTFTAQSYRFGYQGSEKDDEITGSTGTHYTTYFRMLDTRIGRWWSLDPVQRPDVSMYTSMSNNPIIMVDPRGDADFYSRSGNWIGTDGIADNKVYILKSSKLKRDVKRASKHGLHYKGEIQRNSKTFLIPTGQYRNEVLESYRQTVNSQIEHGGHVTEGQPATHWDEGGEAEFYYKDGKIAGQRAGIAPFKVSGGNQAIPENTGNILFMWHVHPDVDLDPDDNISPLGKSTPSDADINFNKDNMYPRGFQGNAFVIGARFNRVSFYDANKSLLNISLDLFRNIVNSRTGRIYNKYLENRPTPDNFDIRPGSQSDWQQPDDVT